MLPRFRRLRCCAATCPLPPDRERVEREFSRYLSSSSSAGGNTGAASSPGKGETSGELVEATAGLPAEQPCLDHAQQQQRHFGVLGLLVDRGGDRPG